MKIFQQQIRLITRLKIFINKNQIIDNINIYYFIMVEFNTLKRNKEIFIGQVFEIDGNEYNCKFLRKNIQMSGFYCFPFIIDEATVAIQQNVKKMKIPK